MNTERNGQRARPSDYIKALVSGMSSRDRARHVMLMIVGGYFDVSGATDTGHLVISGFFGSVDDWSLFSDAWEDVLYNKGPRVEYWHKKETGKHGPLRKILGWQSVQDKERLLRRVIASHNLEPISQSISLAAYRRHVPIERQDKEAHLSGMFWPCFGSLLRRIELKYQDDVWTESVGIYFEPDKARDFPIELAIKAYRERYKVPKKFIFYPLIGEDVAIRIKPFQAADMLCWNIHRGERMFMHTIEPEYKELQAEPGFGLVKTMDKDIRAYSDVLLDDYDPEKDTLRKKLSKDISKDNRDVEQGK